MPGAGGTGARTDFVHDRGRQSETARRLSAAKPQSAHDVRRHHQPLVAFPPQVAEEEAGIKAFLKQHMYRHTRVMRVMGEAEAILFDLFARYQASPGDLPAEWVEGQSARAKASGRGGSAISSPE